MTNNKKKNIKNKFKEKESSRSGIDFARSINLQMFCKKIVDILVLYIGNNFYCI